MSATTVVLLLAATLAAAASGLALVTARRLAAVRRRLAAVEAEARRTRRELRAAVAEALAEERERELAEAWTYWAERAARDAAADAPPLAGHDTAYEISPLERALLDALLGDEDGRDGPVRVPRQPGAEDVDPAEGATGQPDGSEGDPASGEARGTAPADHHDEQDDPTDGRPDATELAAARRRHPSHLGSLPGPGYGGLPVLDGEHTERRLAELARARTPLTEVQVGPLGALDVYVFADGTTLCVSPGHRETAERLGDAARAGRAPTLLGGSAVSGSYTLTFACGEDTVFVLADRVVATD